MDDQVLTSRLLAGDPLAIEAVRGWIRSALQAYRPRLAAEFQDIEQDVLFELTRALKQGKFEGRSRLRTYVTTYVHHKCIDQLRALGRREWVAVEDLDLPSVGPSPLERLSVREKTEMALRVVEEVPESCRELWRLLQEGFSYGEMSRRLGVSEVTLRSRVLRCRRRALEIRERLQKSLQRIPKSGD